MSLREKLKILVVDDTSVSRALICDALDQIGLKNYSIARDGKEAFRAMMTSPSHMIVSDLNMPKLDGLGLLRAVRAYEAFRKVAFILITGRGDSAVLEQGKKYALNNFVAKPFTATSLRVAIEAVTGPLG